MSAEVTKTPVPAAVTTPSRVEARIWDLDCCDGYPTPGNCGDAARPPGLPAQRRLPARRRDVHELRSRPPADKTLHAPMDERTP
jgi:hypothetical protein